MGSTIYLVYEVLFIYHSLLTLHIYAIVHFIIKLPNFFKANLGVISNSWYHIIYHLIENLFSFQMMFLDLKYIIPFGRKESKRRCNYIGESDLRISSRLHI